MDHGVCKPVNAREMLEAASLRPTRQREVIYQTLMRSSSHPTAEELFNDLADHHAVLSLATVYNTLDALTEAGLCHRIQTDRGTARYDACTDPHVHVCLPDGLVVDLPQSLSDAIIASLPAELGSELQRALGVRMAGVSIHAAAHPLGRTASVPGSDA